MPNDCKMGPTGCPETSIISYNFSLRKTPTVRRSHLRGGGSLVILYCVEIYLTYRNAEKCLIMDYVV